MLCTALRAQERATYSPQCSGVCYVQGAEFRSLLRTACRAQECTTYSPQSPGACYVQHAEPRCMLRTARSAQERATYKAQSLEVRYVQSSGVCYVQSPGVYHVQPAEPRSVQSSGVCYVQCRVAIRTEFRVLYVHSVERCAMYKASLHLYHLLPGPALLPPCIGSSTSLCREIILSGHSDKTTSHLPHNSHQNLHTQIT